jgi:hypothetical protein
LLRDGVNPVTESAGNGVGQLNKFTIPQPLNITSEKIHLDMNLIA